MERYVDEGAKTYSLFASRSEAAPNYRPESEQASFDLVSVVVPADRVGIYQADCPQGLDIANYVWWIGIGNAGTLISAMLS